MEQAGEMTIRPIAHIHTAFASKFGVPRQSGLVAELTATVVFEPDYRDAEALRGIEGYSHLWLIWQFSRAVRDTWSPTVRPPRLGGNTRMGVFATRSPFRPNALGLSSVQLVRVERDLADGLRLVVAGADLMDGTPIYDIKPYLPYTDCHPDAIGGFAAERDGTCRVEFPAELLMRLPESQRAAAVGVLAQDPRPAYQQDEMRMYGLGFAGMDIRFRVCGDTVTVIDVCPAQSEKGNTI